MRHLIVTGSWWDLVDEASTAVGEVLQRDRAAMSEHIRAWVAHDDLWLRRAAIICQRHARADTDVALLSDAIETNIDDPDFFIRKAIGWALRAYSKWDAGWVRTYVETHPALSALSRREALKWVERRSEPEG